MIHLQGVSEVGVGRVGDASASNDALGGNSRIALLSAGDDVGKKVHRPLNINFGAEPCEMATYEHIEILACADRVRIRFNSRSGFETRRSG